MQLTALAVGMARAPRRGAARRSGKSSIQKVVFHKMSPNETLFLESTSKVIKNGASTAPPGPMAAAARSLTCRGR